jgi:hypothetical protein
LGNIPVSTISGEHKCIGTRSIYGPCRSVSVRHLGSRHGYRVLIVVTAIRHGDIDILSGKRIFGGVGYLNFVACRFEREFGDEVHGYYAFAGIAFVQSRRGRDCVNANIVEGYIGIPIAGPILIDTVFATGDMPVHERIVVAGRKCDGMAAEIVIASQRHWVALYSREVSLIKHGHPL